MSSKAAEKTSTSGAVVGKKVDVSFSSDSDDDKKSSSDSSSSTSSSSSSSSSSDESDAPATKSIKFSKTSTPPPITTTLTTTTVVSEPAEEDEEETVSFTLSLSTVHIDEPATEEPQKLDEKIEPKTTTRQEKNSKTKTPSPSPSPSPPPASSSIAAAVAAASPSVATVVEEKLEETKRSNSPKKTSDAPVKPQQESENTETKKTSTKKSPKAGTKSSKVDAVDGSEDADEEHAKVKKTKEQSPVQTEPLKKSTVIADDGAITVVNGEAKTTTSKTVKKKTKKTSTDSTTDASANAITPEKQVVKENVTENQSVPKTTLPKAPTMSNAEEPPVVVNGEPETTTKIAKKKVKKPTDSGSVTKEKEKEICHIDDNIIPTEKSKKEAKTDKSEPAKAPSAATENTETSAVKQEPKTTVVKKKPKKAASEVSTNKSSDAQGDVIPSENVTAAAENSSSKATDNVAIQKTHLNAEVENTSGETNNIAASLHADKDSACVTATTGVDKTVIKKKKAKKTAAPASTSPATVETAETTTVSDEQPQISKTISVVENTPPAANADSEPPVKVLGDAGVHVVTNSADFKPTNVIVAEPDAIDDDSAKDATVAETNEKDTVPVATLTATSEETETSNIVTLIQLDNDVGETTKENAVAPVTVLSTETNPETLEPTVTYTADALATDDSLKDTKNEESDFSYRRKSMDDFIKRILAEARDEQQKRMSTTANSTTDTANLIDIDSTTNETKKLGPSLSPTSKDASMLDRRLASTDRKRMQPEEFGERTTRNEDVDLDQDLAEIGRYFSKRNTTGSSRYDAEIDKNADLVGSRIRDIRDLDTDTTKSVVNGQESRYRSQQNGASLEESFVPRAREETADVVRTSSRPVRAIIDQQSDVVQLLKSTSRGVDDLEAEIRGLRATFLDRQARIETLRNAIDAEVRTYHAEQQAVNDRIQQQQIPGGRFVRDEFMRANNIGPSYRSSAIEDLLGTASPRRRSGSVSSTSGIVGGVGPSMSTSDLDYQASVLSSWVMGSRPSANDQLRRNNNDVDDDASSTASGFSMARSRRGGSVVRERSYFGDDPVGSTTRSYLLPSYDSPTSGYSYGSTLTSSYSPLTTSSSLRSYYQNHSDYAPSSSSSAAAGGSYYGSGRETSDYQGSRDHSTSVGYSPFRSSAINDPSRFRRAQSVSDFTSERSLSGDRYNAAASSSQSGPFQSRFLDKVRSRKSTGGEDQYRSRFLASDSGSSSRYHSAARRGYSSND